MVAEVNALAGKGVNTTLIPTVLRKGNPNRFDFHSNVKVLFYPIFSALGMWSLLRLAFRDIKLLFRLLSLSGSSGAGNILKNLVVLPKSILIAEYMRTNNIEHIHAHWLTASATLAMMVSVQTGIPWSVTAHRGDIVSSNALQKKFDSASFVRFISRSGVALAKSRAQIADDKVRILHMGVELPSENFPGLIRNRSEAVTILCPANLLPVKGHSVLLRALSRMEFLDSVRLELAGDGELRQKLTDMAHELGIADKVVFRGHVPHAELLAAYRNAKVDIVVLPSLDLGNGVHEGIPVSLMEAMACGVPVVSTLTGGIPELLSNQRGENVGVLVKAGNEQALATALDELVASPDLRAELGSLGRKRVASDFNQNLIVGELIQLMNSAHGKFRQAVTEKS